MAIKENKQLLLRFERFFSLCLSESILQMNDIIHREATEMNLLEEFEKIRKIEGRPTSRGEKKGNKHDIEMIFWMKFVC